MRINKPKFTPEQHSALVQLLLEAKASESMIRYFGEYLQKDNPQFNEIAFLANFGLAKPN